MEAPTVEIAKCPRHQGDVHGIPADPAPQPRGVRADEQVGCGGQFTNADELRDRAVPWASPTPSLRAKLAGLVTCGRPSAALATPSPRVSGSCLKDESGAGVRAGAAAADLIAPSEKDAVEDSTSPVRGTRHRQNDRLPVPGRRNERETVWLRDDPGW